MHYPRDFQGHGETPPDANWPHSSKIAVQFVLNYEEGGENCVLHGDEASEAFLVDVVGAAPWEGKRHWNVESMYDYGARAGFWRLHRLFTHEKIPLTVFGVATALMRSPAQVAAMLAADWEIASHGLKWVEHKDMAPSVEAQHIKDAIRLHMAATGQKPTGWYTGRCSLNTVDLVSETGAFSYISDCYDDDLPYWREHNGRAQLMMPYSLSTNDMRFVTASGFENGESFFRHLKDSFDVLYAEGLAGRAKMMSVGLHCRLVGQPGRFAGLKRFIDYIRTFEGVWVAKRLDIAQHWAREHPHKPLAMRPSHMGRAEFIERFGGIFEHSAWIAERAVDGEISAAHDTSIGLWSALVHQFRLANDGDRLGVLKAHPDLAGKLAAAKQLTADSSKEQASAGLDVLSDEERAEFSQLNTAYTEKFGFPFIIAVRDNTKASILEAFKRRLNNSYDEEFIAACKQVERIAHLRVNALFES